MPAIFKKHRFLIEIAAVVIVIIVITSLAQYNASPSAQKQNEPVVPPPMTELMTKVLKESTGFQHLVSYTDRGFEPSVLTVKKGETVRFVNNSSRDLWVASAQSENGRRYPSGGRETCGQSAFDSCVSMKPLEFWEFTFTAQGEWSYMNNAQPDVSAVVRVR